MKLNLKALASDFVRGAGVAVAILVIVLNAATGLHIPADAVAYIGILIGALNSIIGAVKPYASSAVKSVFK